MQDTDKQRTEELNQLRLALATFALHSTHLKRG